MNKDEFVRIRKRLEKTQKELSILLGVSLKAISSYEQGWRSIPSHVERQLLFLLVRTSEVEANNCWDIRQCPDSQKHTCPAWEFKAGHMCWFINGTICDHTVHGTWKQKIKVCRRCLVFQAQFDESL